MKPYSCVTWKTLVESALILSLICTITDFAYALPETVVRVEPYASSARVNESFSINVTIADVQNLYGLEFAINWNSSVLALLSVDVRLNTKEHPDGVLYDPVSIYQNQTDQGHGRYILAASSYSPAASFNGSGNLARLTFRVANRGKTKLELQTKLADKPMPGDVATPITHSTTNGVFSQIHIFTNTETITLGETIYLCGSTSLRQANVDVTIAYQHEGSVEWHDLPIIKTSREGNFSYAWQPPEAGKYEIKASALVDDSVETSYQTSLNVEAIDQPSILPYATLLILVIACAAIGALIYMRKQ